MEEKRKVSTSEQNICWFLWGRERAHRQTAEWLIIGYGGNYLYSLLLNSSQFKCPEASLANTSSFILLLSCWKFFHYMEENKYSLNRNWLIHGRTFAKLAIVNKLRIVFPNIILPCVNKSLPINWAHTTKTACQPKGLFYMKY